MPLPHPCLLAHPTTWSSAPQRALGSSHILQALRVLSNARCCRTRHTLSLLSPASNSRTSMRLDIVEPHISLKAGTDQPGMQRQCLGGEQEESAPKASRESYFGADTVMVQPHACPTWVPATASLKNNNKQLKKYHNCNMGDTHPSSLGERETSEEGKGGRGGGPNQTRKQKRKRDGKVEAGGQQPASAPINPTLLETG